MVTYNMVDHKRLYTLLQLIRLLRQPGGFPVERLARRFEVKPRSIYRYLNILRQCGFELRKSDGRYRIANNGEPDPMLPFFSNDEAGIIQEAMLAVHATNPKKTILLQKLELLSDLDKLADIIADASTSAVITKLALAIKEKRQTILLDYSSPHSGTLRDRTVEPLGFSINLRYLHAYDPEQGMVRQFKPERIGDVRVTGRKFVPGERHRIIKPDLFGMNGAPRCTVTLRLKQRAVRLLMEEYPLQVQDLGSSENHQGLNNINLDVNGFEGVGRFVLGLPGEAEAAGPKEFVEYLKKRRSQGNLHSSSSTKKKMLEIST